MKKITAFSFIIIALVFGVIFYQKVELPTVWEGYFTKDYYGQFGPLAICVELLIAGLYLFKNNKKVNFSLALFGFTVLMDFIFTLAGLFSNALPFYAKLIFLICAVWSLWLAFTDTFKLGRITFWSALFSFALGNVVELFFNLW